MKKKTKVEIDVNAFDERLNSLALAKQNALAEIAKITSDIGLLTKKELILYASLYEALTNNKWRMVVKYRDELNKIRNKK